MAASLAPDPAALQTGLGQVASVFPNLDRYYGYFAAIPWNCRATWLARSNNPSAPGGSIATILMTGAKWYGTVDPHEFLAAPSFTPTSWRAQILSAFFDPFEEGSMQSNCLDPLSRLAEMDEIVRAGGTIPSALQARAQAQLHTLAQWMTTQVQAMSKAYDLFHEMLIDVGKNGAILERESRRWEAQFQSRNFTSIEAAGISALANIVQPSQMFASRMTWPIERVDLAWAAVLGVAQSAAARASAADSQAFASALQELDLEAARREWIAAAEMARRLRPSPPAPVDASPFSLFTHDDQQWGNLLATMTDAEMQQDPDQFQKPAGSA